MIYRMITAGLLSGLLLASGVLLFFLAPSARLLIPFFAVPAARALPPSRAVRVLLAITIVMQLFLLAFFTDRTQAFALLSGRLDDAKCLGEVGPSTTTITAVDSI